MKRFTGRQVTAMVIAVCIAVVAAPAAALAAIGTFSSGSASTPAVSAVNTAAGSGAKAVYGKASASSGTVYGVYGRSNSSSGYGVYSSGRLGSSEALVCSHCVTGGDINAASFPTVPNASDLGGHGPSYYARIVPLSWIGTPDTGELHELADVGGLIVYGDCYHDYDLGVQISNVDVATDSAAAAGTINFSTVSSSGDTSASGEPLSTTGETIATSSNAQQVEGTATYRNNATGQIATISFHTYADNCEVFGNVLTAG
jgi:hypothetical protein